jgi:ADP-heptose:LPS heptosyltransferase
LAYTHRTPWTRALVPPRHSVLNQSALLQSLNIDLPSAGTPAVEMPVDAAAAAVIARRLRDAGVPETAPVAVIHVSASSPFRRWPADRFAEVAAHLLRDHLELRIVFTAGPDEQELRRQVTAMAEERAGADAVRVLRGDDVDLRGLRALVERAAVYIGGDSGPTLPERSLPWRNTEIPTVSVDAGALRCRPCDQRHCVPGDFRCLTGVRVEQVAQAASRLLGAAG